MNIRIFFTADIEVRLTYKLLENLVGKGKTKMKLSCSIFRYYLSNFKFFFPFRN